MNDFMETENLAESGAEQPGGSPEQPLSEEQTADLKARAAQSDEFRDRWMRVSADLENFRKRAAREKQEGIRHANEGLLHKLILIADNFDMALAASQTENATVQALQMGIKMIHSQFKSVLADAGLEEIDAVNQPFDPNLHEAVSEQFTNEVPEGHVAQQIRKGYLLREKLLRPASVAVARKPSA
jgi:molecular chaperone GrpE